MIGTILPTFNTHKREQLKHFEPFKVETDVPQEAVEDAADAVETMKMFFGRETPERKNTAQISGRVNDI